MYIHYTLIDVSYTVYKFKCFLKTQNYSKWKTTITILLVFRNLIKIKIGKYFPQKAITRLHTVICNIH